MGVKKKMNSVGVQSVGKRGELGCCFVFEVGVKWAAKWGVHSRLLGRKWALMGIRWGALLGLLWATPGWASPGLIT